MSEIVAAAMERIWQDKEARLASYIAWVALANPHSPALTREHMHAAFGEWTWRQPQLVQRDHSYFLEG